MNTPNENEKKKVYQSWSDFEDECWHNVNADRAEHNKITGFLWIAVLFLLGLKMIFVLML